MRMPSPPVLALRMPIQRPASYHPVPAALQEMADRAEHDLKRTMRAWPYGKKLVADVEEDQDRQCWLALYWEDV